MYLKINQLIVYLLLTIVLCSCKNTIDPTKKLIEDHFKFLNQHNPTELAKQYTRACSMNTPTTQGFIIQQKGIYNEYLKSFQESPDSKYEILSIAKNDSTIFVEYTVSGTHTYNNIKNIDYIRLNCSIFEIEGNKIRREIILFNKGMYHTDENPD